MSNCFTADKAWKKATAELITHDQDIAKFPNAIKQLIVDYAGRNFAHEFTTIGQGVWRAISKSISARAMELLELFGQAFATGQSAIIDAEMERIDGSWALAMAVIAEAKLTGTQVTLFTDQRCGFRAMNSLLRRLWNDTATYDTCFQFLSAPFSDMPRSGTVVVVNLLAEGCKSMVSAVKIPGCRIIGTIRDTATMEQLKTTPGCTVILPAQRQRKRPHDTDDDD